MQASKTRLTKLKNRLNEKLPEGADIYGFQGISKQMICHVIDDSYKILTALDDYESTSFEAVLLERDTAEYYSKAAATLEADFSENSDALNSLLHIIADLHYKIKETYIAVVDSPIRTEAEITIARNELSELKEILRESKPLREELVSIITNASGIVRDLEEKQNNALEKENKIVEDYEAIKDYKTDAEKSANQIPAWEENIKSLKEDIADKQVRYTQLEKQIEILKAETEKTTDENHGLVAVYEQQIESNKQFQTQIQATIEDANRHGMAGSFKKRKDELSKSLILWGVATILSIGLLILLSDKFLVQINKEDIQLARILGKLPVFAACVWLGWFCAKQYGFTSRIMEDYSYKYAVSMAFEGYKNATKDIDEDLQSKLLEMTVYNISSNPLKIYETETNHGTPYHEVLNNLPKSFSLKKKVNNVETEAKVEG